MPSLKPERLILTFFLLATFIPNLQGADDANQMAARRKFRLFYGATVTELKPGSKARIWVPLATSNHEQDVELVAARTPGQVRTTTESMYGNHVMYFEAVADERGEIALDIEYIVERRELRFGQGEAAHRTEAQKHLNSTSLTPVDGTLRKRLFGEQAPQGDVPQLARQVYNSVDDLLRYDKPQGKPWGRGDALWACDSHYGNCTDFHSVFIGACRDLQIPAEFEIGFSIPEAKGEHDIAGYHCWAKFLTDGRWEGVDISEADKHPELKEYYFGNLTADRVTFSRGRDLVLDPPTAAATVNFLVYPYVEVDARPHQQFVKRFRYQDEE